MIIAWCWIFSPYDLRYYAQSEVEPVEKKLYRTGTVGKDKACTGEIPANTGEIPAGTGKSDTGRIPVNTDKIPVIYRWDIIVFEWNVNKKRSIHMFESELFLILTSEAS